MTKSRFSHVDMRFSHVDIHMTLFSGPVVPSRSERRPGALPYLPETGENRLPCRRIAAMTFRTLMVDAAGSAKLSSMHGVWSGALAARGKLAKTERI